MSERQAFAALFLILLAVLALSKLGSDPAPVLIDNVTVSKADYPVCVTVRPSPLLRSPRGPADYRMGEPFNDKGIS